MKEAISQEAVSDISHSRIPEGNEGSASGGLKSAAMLGLALSVGASGALVSQTEATAAVSVPTTPATAEAFLNGSTVPSRKAATPENLETSASAATAQVVGYHTVASGESLWQIAQRHRVGLRELKQANALPPETSIRVGQVLRVPDAQALPQSSEVIPARLVASAVPVTDTAGTAAQTEGTLGDTDLSAEVEAPPTEALQAEIQPASVIAYPEEPTAPTETVQTETIQIEIAERIELADASALQVEPVTASVAISEEAAIAPAPMVTALALPAAATSSYRVQAGDTLSNIASSLGTTSEELMRINRLANPNVIFAGTTLTVPSVSSESLSESQGVIAHNATKKVVPVAETAEQTLANEQLARLQSTAQRPSAARILEAHRNIAAGVGGNLDTAQVDESLTGTEAESSDPYVADLLEEVEEVRTQPVQVSEAPSEISDSAVAGRNEAEIDSRQLIARAATPTNRPSVLEGTENAALPTETTSAELESDLLAAAPISPDAYIPARRSSAGQVVSPDMPILPAADEYLPETPAYFDGYIWPTRGTLTSGYGWRWGRMHRGVDVAGPVGTPIVAAAPGVVEKAGWNSGGYGNLVEIRHPDGSMTRYAHNNRLNVRAGQVVRQGQQISEMGSTGYSTGPHLHFELHPQGSGAANPMAYLPQR